MLTELSIQDFAIIDRVRLSLNAGFNVLTGETGAGKSIIIDALGVLLGGRADSNWVRAGAERARIEGMFALADSQRELLAPVLDEYGLTDDVADAEELILTREITAAGRSTGRVNGRAVTAAVLGAVGEALVDIHGQTEHLSLLRVKQHIDLLDRYAGLGEERTRVAETVRKVRAVRQELATLRRDERELARRQEMLRFQVDEIETAGLQPGEDQDLLAERVRLVNAQKLMEMADAIYAALYDMGEDQRGALDLLDDAHGELSGLLRLDPRLAEHETALLAAMDSLEAIGRAMRDYRDDIESNPERLQEVEDRLVLIGNLKRKYGDSIEDILAFAERASAELTTLENRTERLDELVVQETRLLKRVAEQAEALSQSRRAAGERLARSVEAELTELRMERTQFAVNLERVETPDGCPINGKRYAFDTTGVDRVEFLISPNPGEPLRPLVKIASGGETSRLMLALKSVLAAGDTVPTLIFDEIDQGIGGRVGEIVGRKLWKLTVANGHAGLTHQVICITHLPQIAAYGDTHFNVSKRVVGDRTATLIQPVEAEARVTEIMTMLGADTDLTRQAASEMLRSTVDVKEGLLSTS